MLFERMEYWLPDQPNPIRANSSVITSEIGTVTPTTRVPTTPSPVQRLLSSTVPLSSCSAKIEVERGKSFKLRGIEIPVDAIDSSLLRTSSPASISINGSPIAALRIGPVILLPEEHAYEIEGSREVEIVASADGVVFYETSTTPSPRIPVIPGNQPVLIDIFPSRSPHCLPSAIISDNSSNGRMNEYLVSSSFASFHFYSHAATASVSLLTIISIFWGSILRDRPSFSPHPSAPAPPASSAVVDETYSTIVPMADSDSASTSTVHSDSQNPTTD